MNEFNVNIMTREACPLEKKWLRDTLLSVNNRNRYRGKAIQ